MLQGARIGLIAARNLGTGWGWRGPPLEPPPALPCSDAWPHDSPGSLWRKGRCPGVVPLAARANRPEQEAAAMGRKKPQRSKGRLMGFCKLASVSTLSYDSKLVKRAAQTQGPRDVKPCCDRLSMRLALPAAEGPCTSYWYRASSKSPQGTDPGLAAHSPGHHAAALSVQLCLVILGRCG